MKVPNEWLTQRVENRPIAQHRDLAPMAALRVRREWEKLKAQAGEGDELWAFANPSNTWKRLGKHTGYALVREGKIVQSVVVTSG
ncbi:MAG TPA: hypothetical protein VF746_28745 [Longimicrobium sp.]|jgi:hypothetical protein